MVAQVLLTHHADANACNEGDWTPLHLASAHGHPKVIRLLIEHGADVDPKDIIGETPLYVSSNGDIGTMEAAQVLLEYGADPNSWSEFDGNILYEALRRYGNQGLTQLLLKYGADPNDRDVEGRTLLHVSSREGAAEAAKALLELGVDVNSRDNEGRTPLQYANDPNIRIDREQVAQVLLKHGATI